MGAFWFTASWIISLYLFLYLQDKNKSALFTNIARPGLCRYVCSANTEESPNPDSEP